MVGGRFQPGKSGNPGGRPKEVEGVRELARQHTGEAIQTLAAIMRNCKEPAAARVRAAECVLDRGWGRPETTANVKFPRDVRDLSTDELLAIIAKDPGAGAGIGDGNHGGRIDSPPH